MPDHRLTPAGQQVERALAMGYVNAAFNIYSKNISDDIAMVEGDEAGQVSVWPEWHRMIQARIGGGQTAAEALVEKMGLEGAAELLGVHHDVEHPDDTLAEIEGELEGSTSQMEAWQPTRNAKGEIISN
jgi:hypothetical protein